MSKRAAAVGSRRIRATGTMASPPAAAPKRGQRSATNAGPSVRQSRALGKPRRRWWRGPLPVAGTGVIVLAIVGVFVLLATNSSDSQIGRPADPAVVQKITAISPTVLAQVGGGGNPNPYIRVAGTMLSAQGRPEVLYIGAEFCRYCAGQRWSLINALGRFGTFTNLHYMRSAPSEGNYVTFTFQGSRYESRYVSFVPVEVENRSGASLMPMTAAQQRYYTSFPQNGVPFISVAGRYVNLSSHVRFVNGFDPALLDGKDWAQAAQIISDPRQPLSRGVLGQANDLTAAICMVTHDQPPSVCDASFVHRLQL